MDSRHPRRPSADRFLAAFSPPSTAASSFDAAAGNHELTEDDVVFFTGSDFSSPPSTSTSPSLIHHTNHGNRSFKSPESFGILAALPESGADLTNRSVFNHKPLISPSSSSRVIPVALRRSPAVKTTEEERKFLYHQSAPMNVPMMPTVRERLRRKGSAFGYEDNNDDDGDDEDDDGKMLPPHEIVARQMSNSPALSCSVLEGAGRTLKGRDLRQVRNAVFRQTGFID